MNDQVQWMERNEQHLTAAVAWVRLRLQGIAPPPRTKTRQKRGCLWFSSNPPPVQTDAASLTKASGKEIAKAYQEMVALETGDPPPALILLGNRLKLSPFERCVLALCAAMELDTRIAPLCARVHDDPAKPYPTFALAFALFDDPDWSVLSPHRALRYWRLLEIEQPGGRPLTAAALRADERIVNYLKGLNYLDDRLTPLVEPLAGPADSSGDTGRLPQSQQHSVDQILQRLSRIAPQEKAPVIELVGRDTVSKRLVARQVVQPLGLSLQAMNIKALPSQSADFDNFARLWQREARLLPIALYIETQGTGDGEKALLKRFLDRNNGVIFVDGPEGGPELMRQRMTFEIGKPTPEEQEQLWRAALRGQGDGYAARLAEQFAFNQFEIGRLAAGVLGEQTRTPEQLQADLWQACRVAARESMEQLAQRIDAKATWERLVLPAEQKELLRRITQQVNQRNKVYKQWGFRDIMNRGLGINALFAGESGTGKTMAAEVIANDLGLDLYRIDLSAVVNKYIGETEKNLRRLFDVAEESGAILFFDEADALFGKRSEVKDSHDRYANIEVNYLLQRMESYRGLAILATNMKSALDKAFMRRLRFIVEFPFPGATERKEIWQKVFPAETPLDDPLDYDYLARLNLSGGGIHNVALNAAFKAAQTSGPVTMAILLDAAQAEFKKLERPVKASDFEWHKPTGGGG
jgi:SpoVK/Ycf46/Vps4 family AAA+-type ATPase